MKLSLIEQSKALPIYTLCDQLLQAILDNQILMVVGKTGSGKTTQRGSHCQRKDLLHVHN